MQTLLLYMVNSLLTFLNFSIPLFNRINLSCRLCVLFHITILLVSVIANMDIILLHPTIVRLYKVLPFFKIRRSNLNISTVCIFCLWILASIAQQFVLYFIASFSKVRCSGSVLYFEERFTVGISICVSLYDKIF